MSDHKAVVEDYTEGFRRTDHHAILGCLTDDVLWVIHGHRTLRGKEAAGSRTKLPSRAA
jgi:uncharacterized protein